MDVRRSDRLFAGNRWFVRAASTLAPDLTGGEKIDGLIQPREGLLLYLLARDAVRLGNLVEIGAYRGRSTWYLAKSIQDSGSPHKLLSIDPHIDPHQRVAYFDTIDHHGIRSAVDPHTAYSHDVATSLPDIPVGMVWIDGDHSYPAVRQDFDDWFPRLAPGGWVAIHDTVNVRRGPTKLARELLGHRRDLRDIGVVHLITFARKAAEPRLGNLLAGVHARLAFEALTLMQARHAGFGPQG